MSYSIGKSVESVSRWNIAKEVAYEVGSKASIFIPAALGYATGVKKISTAFGIGTSLISIVSLTAKAALSAPKYLQNPSAAISSLKAKKLLIGACELASSMAILYTAIYGKNSLDDLQETNYTELASYSVLALSSLYSIYYNSQKAMQNLSSCFVFGSGSKKRDYLQLVRGVTHLAFGYLSLISFAGYGSKITTIIANQSEMKKPFRWEDSLGAKLEAFNTHSKTCWDDKPWEHENTTQLHEIEHALKERTGMSLTASPKRPSAPMSTHFKEYFCWRYEGKINSPETKRDSIDWQETDYVTQCEFEESLKKSVEVFNHYLDSLPEEDREFAVILKPSTGNSNPWVFKLALRYFSRLPATIFPHATDWVSFNKLSSKIKTLVIVDDACYSGTQLAASKDRLEVAMNDVALKFITPYASLICREWHKDHLIAVEQVPANGNLFFDHNVADLMSAPPVLSHIRSFFSRRRHIELPRPYNV